MGYASSGEKDITCKVGCFPNRNRASWSVPTMPCWFRLEEFGFLTKNFTEQHVGQTARA